MPQGIIKYIVIIIIILVIVFLSQYSYSQNMIKNFFSFLENNAGASLIGGFKFSKDIKKDVINNEDNKIQLQNKPISTSSNTSFDKKWAILNFPQKIFETIKNGGEAVENSIDKINNIKEKISENISNAEENIKNYFSGIGNSIINPGTPQNCPPIENSSSNQSNSY